MARGFLERALMNLLLTMVSDFWTNKFELVYDECGIDYQTKCQDLRIDYENEK
jgi:hypothetical protein